MKIKLTDEEKETLSYDDVAYMIISNTKKKMKIQELFKKVIDVMDLDEDVFEDKIGEFYEEIATDKRFAILDNGYCDLKINHSTKVIIEDDEDDLDISQISTEEDEEEDDMLDEDNYDDTDDDEDITSDELDDLVIIDEEEEVDGEML